MKKFYSFWVIFSISFFFFLFIIPLILFSLSVKTHKYALKINHWWAWGFFRLAGLPIKIKKSTKLDKNQQYIICSNHFSYLDIPSVGLLPINVKFFGKSELSIAPLFGYMYRKLHITVDRTNAKTRQIGFENARTAIQQGFNLCFFPEGGIRLENYPEMAPFKQGAFRLAAEFDLPILPITFPDNYFIFNIKDGYKANFRPFRMTMHQPIKAESNTEEAIKKLQAEVCDIIQSELNNYNS